MNCCTEGCGNEPVVTVFWPGSTCVMCKTCALRAMQVAKVMGFDLPIGHLGVGAAPLAEEVRKALLERA